MKAYNILNRTAEIKQIENRPIAITQEKKDKVTLIIVSIVVLAICLLVLYLNYQVNGLVTSEYLYTY